MTDKTLWNRNININKNMQLDKTLFNKINLEENFTITFDGRWMIPNTDHQY